ncbi:hypothetical protein, variant [Capsaspora owczarzaki ATCC 30864]|nr:hypothetical protein, variant [Capsaspora owczarzaki ATCC 30864]
MMGLARPRRASGSAASVSITPASAVSTNAPRPPTLSAAAATPAAPMRIRRIAFGRVPFRESIAALARLVACVVSARLGTASQPTAVALPLFIHLLTLPVFVSEPLHTPRDATQFLFDTNNFLATEQQAVLFALACLHHLARFLPQLVDAQFLVELAANPYLDDFGSKPLLAIDQAIRPPPSLVVSRDMSQQPNNNQLRHASSSSMQLLIKLGLAPSVESERLVRSTHRQLFFNREKLADKVFLLRIKWQEALVALRQHSTETPGAVQVSPLPDSKFCELVWEIMMQLDPLNYRWLALKLVVDFLDALPSNPLVFANGSDPTAARPTTPLGSAPSTPGIGASPAAPLLRHGSSQSLTHDEALAAAGAHAADPTRKAQRFENLERRFQSDRTYARPSLRPKVSSTDIVAACSPGKLGAPAPSFLHFYATFLVFADSFTLVALARELLCPCVNALLQQSSQAPSTLELESAVGCAQLLGFLDGFSARLPTVPGQSLSPAPSTAPLGSLDVALLLIASQNSSEHVIVASEYLCAFHGLGLKDEDSSRAAPPPIPVLVLQQLHEHCARMQHASQPTGPLERMSVAYAEQILFLARFTADQPSDPAGLPVAVAPKSGSPHLSLSGTSPTSSLELALQSFRREMDAIAWGADGDSPSPAKTRSAATVAQQHGTHLPSSSHTGGSTTSSAKRTGTRRITPIVEATAVSFRPGAPTPLDVAASATPPVLEDVITAAVPDSGASSGTASPRFGSTSNLSSSRVRTLSSSGSSSVAPPAIAPQAALSTGWRHAPWFEKLNEELEPLLAFLQVHVSRNASSSSLLAAKSAIFERERALLESWLHDTMPHQPSGVVLRPNAAAAAATNEAQDAPDLDELLVDSANNANDQQVAQFRQASQERVRVSLLEARRDILQRASQSAREYIGEAITTSVSQLWPVTVNRGVLPIACAHTIAKAHATVVAEMTANLDATLVRELESEYERLKRSVRLQREAPSDQSPRSMIQSRVGLEELSRCLQSQIASLSSSTAQTSSTLCWPWSQVAGICRAVVHLLAERDAKHALVLRDRCGLDPRAQALVGELMQNVVGSLQLWCEHFQLEFAGRHQRKRGSSPSNAGISGSSGPSGGLVVRRLFADSSKPAKASPSPSTAAWMGVVELVSEDASDQSFAATALARLLEALGILALLLGQPLTPTLLRPVIQSIVGAAARGAMKPMRCLIHLALLVLCIDSHDARIWSAPQLEAELLALPWSAPRELAEVAAIVLSAYHYSGLKTLLQSSGRYHAHQWCHLANSAFAKSPSSNPELAALMATLF